MAHHVLDDDDGVVHHESRSDRQGHEREVVDAVADEVHEGEGADQGHGDDDAGNGGGPDVAKEEEDDEHHEGHRDHQGDLHVVDGGADGDGLVEHRR